MMWQSSLSPAGFGLWVMAMLIGLGVWLLGAMGWEA